MDARVDLGAGGGVPHIQHVERRPSGAFESNKGSERRAKQQQQQQQPARAAGKGASMLLPNDFLVQLTGHRVCVSLINCHDLEGTLVSVKDEGVIVLDDVSHFQQVVSSNNSNNDLKQHRSEVASRKGEVAEGPTADIRRRQCGSYGRLLINGSLVVHVSPIT